MYLPACKFLVLSALDFIVPYYSCCKRQQDFFLIFCFYQSYSLFSKVSIIFSGACICINNYYLN